MSHFFYQISWYQFFSAAFILSIVYYLWIFRGHYRPEIQIIKDRLSGNNGRNQLPEALQYQAESGETNLQEKSLNNNTQLFYEQEPGEDPGPLLNELKTCIGEASGKPPAPAVLIPKLQKILQGYPEMAGSPFRQPVNEAIVQECKKTGTALLQEDEVDQWWST